MGAESTSSDPDHPPGASYPRYRAESQLLQRAIAGDQPSVGKVLKYLGASNPDLRQMMQATVRDLEDPLVWRRLLDCMAFECWGELPEEEVDSAQFTQPATTLPPIPLDDNHTQSIAEIFVIDESESERDMKDALLSEALDHEDSHVRFASAYLRGLRGDLNMIPRLEEMIESDEISWQLRAVQALVVIHDEGCGTPLIQALAKYRHPSTGSELHQAARRALSDLGRKAQPALLEALNHPDSHIRWHAARGLGQIGDTRGTQVLAAGLYDENQAVRWATASVLANLDATAVPAILNVLTRQPINEPFRQAAYHSLHAMPSKQTREYLEPLLLALRSPSAPVQAPLIAQRLLEDWNR